MKKILLASLALAAVTTSAMAAPRHQVRNVAPGTTSDSVVSDGVVIGKDPDAFVRYELLREAASPNQG
jgi:hypothetical protein